MLSRILGRFLELEETGEGEYLTTCPFHDDNRPSLSANVGKKVFFCHACQKKGSIIELLAKLANAPEALVRLDLGMLEDFEPPKFDINHFHKKLLANDKVMRYLTDVRLWKEEVIKELRIGFDGNRVTIPVFDCFGSLVNVRAYKPAASKEEPKVINLKGYGKARIYLAQHIGNGDGVLYIVEGEPDAIAGRSVGIPAVSSTAGAGHFNVNWASTFKGKTVRVLYDADDAGVRGAERTAAIVAKYAADTRIVPISEVLTNGKDLTDYLVQGGSPKILEELAEDVDPLVVTRSVGDEDDEEVHEVSLSDSSQEKYYRKKVRMKVMISGKMLSPYIVPRDVKVYCNTPGLNICKACAMGSGEAELTFDCKHDETLQLVETYTENHIKIFKKMIGIPVRCNMVMHDVLKAQNIEESKVIPDLDFSTDDSLYVLRQIYYMGHGLEANSVYELVGKAIPHPKTQQVTYLIEEATSLDDTVSAFKVTDEVINRLRIFSVDEDKEEAQ